MSIVRAVAFDELRYWYRSKLGITVLLIGLCLTFATVVVNGIEQTRKASERNNLQQVSEERFLEQPDRHPHRMVHYGHYVFRAPAPLSALDSGVDSYTGTSMFLEGHRQNTAMFSDQRQSSGIARFSNLSPSSLMQVLAPLILIVIGYVGVTREREAGSIDIFSVQGINMWSFLLGKLSALALASAFLVIPFALSSLMVGDELAVSLIFVLGYYIYLLVWCVLVVSVSAVSHKSSISFSVSVTLWVLFCVLLPRIGSSTAITLEPLVGKLENDFSVIEELKKLGDGHNVNDPKFAKLKANILSQYQVEKIEELPINFRGFVAQYSEEKLTDVLNKFSDNRMENELQQVNIARQFGWVSPMIAIRSFSMVMAGTSIETHHRFLREAESVRFGFVQFLNKAHQDQLDYKTDINRYKNANHLLAARVDARNWGALKSFNFNVSSGEDRWRASFHFIAQLIAWLLFVLILLVFAKRRLEK